MAAGFNEAACELVKRDSMLETVKVSDPKHKSVSEPIFFIV